MCGIAGIITPNAKKYSSELNKMINCLKHRGPDGQSTFIFDNAGLGHARLSIIDLSTGDQPMLTADKKIGLIFNGEIYGYKEIREKLRKDYRFKTTSDTEVIIAMYKKYGPEFVRSLPGMFVYALWDDVKKELHVGRDRFGEKPFYYAFGSNGEFIFASEIKSILSTGLIKPKLNHQALNHYLKHLYIHPSETIYENVYTLSAGHCLMLKDGRVKEERYYKLPKINSRISLEEAIFEFNRLLHQAVKNQLVADVPVGAFLSGGLDSSTIVGIASNYKDDLNTFSFNFPGDRSEIKYAREIAKKYKTKHRELSANEDIGELLLQMGEIYDEPFADSSNIPTYLISKMTRKYVTVALSGDGGDELFGGYDWYKPFLHWKDSKRLRIAKKLIYKHLLISSNLLGNSSLILKKEYIQAGFLSNFSGSFEDAHKSQNLYFTDSDIRKLTKKKYPAETFRYKTSGQAIDRAMQTDLLDYLPGDILVKTDRASMANGLELRSPFLDSEFANFVISLPYQLKISESEDKIILREACADLWTDNIRVRGKMGFGAPVDKWMRKKSVRELKDYYLSNKARKIFHLYDYEAVQYLGRKDNYLTWILLVLSIWFELHQFDL